MTSLLSAHGAYDGQGAMMPLATLRNYIGLTTTRLIFTAENVPQALQDILRFSDDPSLLRASRAGRVMRRGAAIFKNSTGSADTYDLSKVVTTIDTFISHNWTTSHWKKYLILALHFNCHVALLVNTWVMCSLMLLGYFGALPSAVFAVTPEYPRGLLARVLSIPTFLIVLLLCRDVLPARCSPTVFLDKTCIHQIDEQRKRQGIQKLGAFLMHSKHMLVCYNQLYLSKLWTVYELATFLTTSPASNIKFMPTHIPEFVVCGLLIFYVVDMTNLALQWTGSKLQPMLYSYPFLCLGVALMLRRASRERLQIRTRLMAFRVRDAHCFCEDDREIVNTNVAQMMRLSLGLPEETGDREALEHFDQLVRNELPEVVDGGCGRFGFPYRFWTLTAYVASFPYYVCDSFCGWPHGMTWRFFFVNRLLWCFFVVFVWSPFTFGVFLDKLASVRLEWRGAREALWMSIVMAIAAVWIVIINYAVAIVEKLASHSDVALVLYTAGDLFFAAAIYWFMVWRRQRSSILTGSQLGGPRLPVGTVAAPDPIDVTTVQVEDDTSPLEAPRSLASFGFSNVAIASAFAEDDTSPLEPPRSFTSLRVPSTQPENTLIGCSAHQAGTV